MPTLQTHAPRRTFVKRFIGGLVISATALSNIACAGEATEEWPSWRGPNETGESSAINLVSDWAIDGDNLIWQQPFIGRSRYSTAEYALMADRATA